MSTDAKRRGNQKYLRTMVNISVRVTPDQAAEIRARAAARGLSVQQLFLRGAESLTGEPLPPSRSEIRAGKK